MTLHRTGPGRVTTDSRVPRGGVRAVLINFDIDGDTPKAEHKHFLDQHVTVVLVGKRARIWLQGMASHSGPDAHNMQLSRRRADNVAAYLRSRGVQASQIQIDAVGESMATPRVSEAAADRAVALLAAPLGTIALRPPARSTPAVRPTNTSFRIKLHAALSGGAAFVGVEQLIFQIWDTTNHVTCYYLYTAGGVGRSLLPVSATLEGPWNDFRTNRPLGVTEFGGAARFTTAGSGPLTLNYLNMMGLPSGVTTVPASMPIITGFTIGIGAGTSVGYMRAADPTAWPYSGP